MGDVADMVLEGLFCEGCGAFMGNECGYPRRCEECQKDVLHDAMSRKARELTGATARRRKHGRKKRNK